MLDFANEILRGLFALLAIPIGGSIELRSRLRVKLNFSGASHGPAPYARLVTSAHGFVLTVPAFSSYKSSDLPLPFEFRCFIDGVLVKAG